MSDDRLIRDRIIVKGVVQGVGFRYFALDLARRYRLSGFARNRGDGTVEVEAEGGEGVVRAFVEDLRVGPRAASVSGIEVEPLTPIGKFEGFNIRF